MKLSTAPFFVVLSILLSITAISSCSRTISYAGQWQGNSERILVPGAEDASAVVTLDLQPIEKGQSGNVVISAVINIQQASPVPGTYMTSLTATANVNGSYVTEDHDLEDIILSLDPSSLNVMVDPAAVTINNGMVANMPHATLDSISKVEADRWRVAITPTVRQLFERYNSIEDIKVHHSDMMSAEIAHRDYTFRRVGVPN